MAKACSRPWPTRSARALPPSQKYLLPKYFYDARGSELFERITEQPEYYLTQTEHELLAGLANELMATLRPHELVELGSGSSSKTRVLLDAASAPQHLRRYVPFDVSESMVRGTAQELLDAYPFLEVYGVIGDFERHLDRISPPTGGRLVLFLGSTIGNLELGERRRFLSGVRALLGSEGRLLLGLDLVKDLDALNAAYNDDDASPPSSTGTFSRRSTTRCRPTSPPRLSSTVPSSTPMFPASRCTWCPAHPRPCTSAASA